MGTSTLAMTARGVSNGGMVNNYAAPLNHFLNVAQDQRVSHVPAHTREHDFQRIVKSFQNLV